MNLAINPTSLPVSLQVKRKTASGVVKISEASCRGFAANDPLWHRGCSDFSVGLVSGKLFQGQYYDPETGLHYNRHRYYDPQTGSFLTEDPIKLKGGINNFRYVPNPISWVDPLGLQNKEDHGGGGKVSLKGLTQAAALSTMLTAAPVQYSEPSFIDALIDPEYWSIVGDRISSGEALQDAKNAALNMGKIGAGSVAMVGGYALTPFSPVVGGYMMADGASIYAGGVSDLGNQFYGTSNDHDFMKHAYRNASELYGDTPAQGDIARASVGVVSVVGAWTTPVKTVINAPKNGWTGTSLTYEKTVPAVKAASATELTNDIVSAKGAFELLMLRMSLMEINIWLAYFIFISTTALQYLVLLRMNIWGKFRRDVLCIPAVFLILFSLWISSIDSNLYEYSGYIMLAITISLFIAKVKKDGDGLW